jgi:hypothetical protein
MKDNNTLSFLDLPDLIATELIQTEDKNIFVAENKQKSIKCPNCHQVTDKVLDR